MKFLFGWFKVGMTNKIHVFRRIKKHFQQLFLKKSKVEIHLYIFIYTPQKKNVIPGFNYVKVIS